MAFSVAICELNKQQKTQFLCRRTGPRTESSQLYFRMTITELAHSGNATLRLRLQVGPPWNRDLGRMGPHGLALADHEYRNSSDSKQSKSHDSIRSPVLRVRPPTTARGPDLLRVRKPRTTTHRSWSNFLHLANTLPLLVAQKI